MIDWFIEFVEVKIQCYRRIFAVMSVN